MNLHAITVLEAAEAQAKEGPIAGTAAIRLALSWLAANKVAELWQVENFWKALTVQRDPPHGMYDYCRQRDLRICIDRWKSVAKV